MPFRKGENVANSLLECHCEILAQGGVGPGTCSVNVFPTVDTAVP